MMSFSMSVSMVLSCGFGSDLEDGHDDEFQGTLTEILPPKGGEQSDLDGSGQLRRFRKMQGKLETNIWSFGN